MRKTQYGKALEAIKFLVNSAEEIKKDLSQREITNAMDRLIKCQEKAIELGMMIEASEGEGFVTVSYLEEYCEMIYQVYEGIHQNNALSPNNIYKKLNKGIIKIENSIKNDVKIRKEAVFLPYKASMWDSLESIWMAANDDPDCDAYVIPIPYFDKNPDGSFKEMHYEGDQYPKYVPIIKYNEFDFETHHPDMIYFHAPYDEYNFVTSVHPAFYAKELKKYTEKLVYVPYFVSTTDVPEHFCVLPGTMYADKVILQSVKVRDTYINVFGTWAKESGYDKIYPAWKEKFLALGSPKFDKTSSTGRKDSSLPVEWKKKLYDEKGIRRKAILYNTSIGDLLENPEMLGKIKCVLELFRSCSDVILWWRPHPLYESTLASMRPDMLQEYRRIVDWYQQEDFGIFDTTSDMNRAIAETDLYFGDHSSLVALYKSTGKPVMIQSPYIVEPITEQNVRNIPVWASTMCVDGDDIWFVHGKVNALFKYDERERILQFIGCIPEEKIFMEKMYSNIHKINEYIYIIPCWAEKIVKYSIREGKYSFIDVAEIGSDKSVMKYTNSFYYNGILYCVPYRANKIVKIDILNNDRVTYLHLDNKDNEIRCNAAMILGGIIHWVTGENNCLYSLDTNSEVLDIKHFGTGKCKFCSFAIINDNIFFYDKEKEQIYKFNLFQQDIWLQEMKMREPVKIENFTDDLILCQGTEKNHFVIFDENMEILKEDASIFHKYRTLENDYYHGSVCANSINDRIYFDDSHKNKIVVWKEKKIIDQIDLSLSIKQVNEISNQYLRSEQMLFYENELFGILTFMNLDKKASVQKSSCGKTIYREMKE